MKKYILAACLFLTIHAMAQTDSTQKKQDTIRIGNMVIVGDQQTAVGDKKHLVNLNIDIDNKGKQNRKNGMKIYGKNDTLLSVSEDTVKVGRIKIINKQDGDYNKDWQSLLQGDFKKTKISIEREPKKLKQISTNWWVFDLGFANLADKTNQAYYAVPYQNGLSIRVPSSTDLKLNNAKSSNVNIWIVQQKLNLHQHYWNLKYGVGIEMYNFRFEQPISFRNVPDNYVYFDNVNFRKNKLFVEYLTVPIQLNYQSNPGNNKSFYASLGLSAGYLIQSHTKQISDERGKKKVNGNFDLSNTKMATIGELGIGSIRLYGSYSLSNMFDKNLTSFDMAPFAIGLRFSKF